MSAVLTPGDLAELLHVPEAKVLEWRRVYNWPSLKVGRKIRFTAEQVEQILAAHSGKPRADVTAVVVDGQTARSAGRKRSA